MRSLQEKFQITTPMPAHKKDEAAESWLPWKKPGIVGNALGSARQNQSNVGGYRIRAGDDQSPEKFNGMPPGMDISNQFRTEIHEMPFVMSGESDVSKDTTGVAFREGFIRRDMKGTDDQYTGEHVDHFYGAAIGDDGNEGFVERNNYLDRE